MATLTFDVDIIYEGTGHFLSFEYQYETYGNDYTREEIDDLVDDLVSSRNPELYNEIMDNISIVPSVSHVEYDPEEDDE